MAVYAELAAYASTGKSNAMNKSRKAYETVEKFYNTPSDKSQLINAPTVESLTKLLEDLHTVIGK
jgi:hypothetical protein